MYNNFVKIKSNPYTKQMEYFYKNEGGEWIPVSSRLASDAFTNVTIQHKVHEIMIEINNVYNLGNKGLEIVFEGTKEDYEDICTEVSEYFKDYKINCSQGEMYLASAETVITEITNIFKDIRVAFQEYPDDEIAEELSRFNDTIKPVVAICVMGLYSSGKSAFINSLLGNEVLPSASDPTTAKNYKIISSKEARILFQYDDVPIELTFDGENYRANRPGEFEIMQELQEAMDLASPHTVFSHIYKALQVINGYDDNHGGEKHISTLIEVYVPFVNSNLPLSQFDFAIYDTPGSDSNHREHLEVLKDSLHGQTNGLPIFVTTPDEMDKEKNNEIIDIIEKMGEALDQTNTIVVVNKSDEKDSGVLDAKRKRGNELRVTKWHSSRVFFASAIMGLGSKREKPLSKDSWMDKQYFKVFKQQYDSFANPEDDFYMQLYKYDFLPRSREDQIRVSADQVTDGAALVYLNSGIRTVEEEIALFAHKYAWYNKCVQARQYLGNAVDLVLKRSKEAESRRRKIEDEIKKDIGEKAKALIEELGREGIRLAESINAGYSDGIQKIVDEVFHEETENEKMESAWEKVKKAEKKDDKRNRSIEAKVDEQYADLYSAIREKVGGWSKAYWAEAEKRYKGKCCFVVMGSSALTDEQKAFLQDYVMNSAGIEVQEIKMDMHKENVIKDKKFLFLFKIGERFVLENCQKSFAESVNRSILKMSQKAVGDNEDRFRVWRERLEMDLESKITSFNPLLAQLSQYLDDCRKEIARLNEQRNVLEKQRDRLESLLTFKRER